MCKKTLKKLISVSAAICLAAAMMTGCGEDNGSAGSSASEEPKTAAGIDVSIADLTTPGVNVDLVGDYSQEEIAASWSEDDAVKIVFDGNHATITGDGAAFAEGKVTISEGGTYVLSGQGQDVQVIVDAAEDAQVQLVLNGVTLAHGTTAPVNIVNGDEAIITLAEGTENRIKDTRAAYVEGETEETATSEDELIEGAIFSEIDLVFNGSGKLTVEAGFDDGIRTKDDMKLIGGTYQVTSQDDAFVGKDSISIRDGEYTVNAIGAAFKSNNEEDLEKGFVVVDGGTFDLTAKEGDGFHGEFVLVINDGQVLIRESEEGLEAMNIIINGGDIELTSTDDGVNISEAENYTATFGAESETAAQGAQMPQGIAEDTAVDHIPGALIINGGTLKVTAQGDGLDSNGDILIAGGTTVVCGPTNAGNGSLDYADSFNMTGGILAISGNQGMEQSIASESIAVVTVNFGSQQKAGTKVVISDKSGKELFGFTGNHDFSYVAFASPELEKDSVYKVAAGTETVEGTATISPAMNMGFGGMKGGGQMPQGERPEMPEGTEQGEGPELPEGVDPGQKMEMPEGADPGQRMERPEMPEGMEPPTA